MSHELLVSGAVAVAICATSGSCRAQAPEELFQEAVVRFNLAKFQQSPRLLHRARRATKDQRLLGRIYLYVDSSSHASTYLPAPSCAAQPPASFRVS